MQHILQISDTHLGREPGPIRPGYPDSDRQLARVLEALRRNEARPDLLWLTGDLAEDPEPAAYTRLLGMLDEHVKGWPLAGLAGNHDDWSLLHRAFTGAGHALDGHRLLGDWLLVGINSAVEGQASGRIEPAELSRLNQVLNAHPDHWGMVAVHHPVVPVGSAWMDRIGLANPDDLFAILDRHPRVRACLFGHIHQDFRAERQGVELLGCPSTCVQFAPGSEQFALDTEHGGYRVLALHADGRIDTRVERIPGELPEARA
ncbi:metallophosphoesterase [Thioalkalivibrio sp. ALMg11]|uniref:metallophosphoesterase n=1 Tax=Thioalkalivibrio sp. ALMg11 TaxID=1158165 RepID=UPI00036149CE|nr:metallophosphoesterase [Thioalkalivibrio sp. ALMg11]